MIFKRTRLKLPKMIEWSLLRSTYWVVGFHHHENDFIFKRNKIAQDHRAGRNPQSPKTAVLLTLLQELSPFPVEPGGGSIPGAERSPRGGHGNPLQYSCLENPWTEEPGGLQSIRSQRVGQDWSVLAGTPTRNHQSTCLQSEAQDCLKGGILLEALREILAGR